MSEYKTVFGSLAGYEKGGVQIIDDDPRHYTFSNVFEVAANARSYERIAVAKNLEYVMEAVRAEGRSFWYAADHDEFAIIMDGEVEIELMKPAVPMVAQGHHGAVRLDGEPDGERMGRMVCRRGHQALLPAGSAYRFSADRASVMILQTIAGEETVEKWAEICQTES